MKIVTSLLVFLSLLLSALISPLSWAESKAPRSLFNWSTEWTEEKLVDQIKKNDRAFTKRRWGSAIKSGEIALDGCHVLFNKLDQRCIVIMKKNVIAYARSGQIASHTTEITQAYQLATQALGKKTFTTAVIRDIYRRLLLDIERYEETVPVVIETIEIERALQNDEFKILDWEILLYALYVVTEQREYEEPTLLRMLALTEKNIGVDSENFYRVASTLAESYCEQKKYNEFFDLIGTYNIDTKCLSKEQPDKPRHHYSLPQ